MLPHFTVVHKQDWFTQETYRPELEKDSDSFLSRSFQLHFNERPYLQHRCYLFLTKTNRERMQTQSLFSTLSRGFIIPKETDTEAAERFLEAVDQFVGILNESGYLHLTRLTTPQIVEDEGLLSRYLSLGGSRSVLQDMRLDADRMVIGDNTLCVHTLSDVEDMPQQVSTDKRYGRFSTDRSDCRLSFAAPVGLLLNCNHIYNQYVRQEVV